MEPLECIARDRALNPERLNAARRTALEEIDASLAVVAYTRGARNALTPVGRLPPEILTQVFHYLVHACPPREVVPDCLFDLGWINVTRVRRPWRRIALDNPSLWSTIRFVLGDRWSREILERSKNSLLDVELNVPANQQDRSYIALLEEILSTHMHHIHRLAVSAPEGVMSQIFARKAMAKPAPFLECLELGVSSVPRLPVQPVANLFGGQAPRLCPIKLDRIPGISWTPIADDIITLRLHGRSQRLTWASYEGLLGALGRATDLRRISTHYSLPDADVVHNGGASTLQIIHLPNLERLSLNDSMIPCTRLLSRLGLPPAVTLKLRCGSFNDNDRNAFIGSITAAHGNSSFTLRSLSISVLKHLDIHAGDSNELEVTPFTQITLTSNRPPSEWTDAPLLKDICFVWRLYSLYSLHISADMWTMNTQEWIDVFGAAKNIKALEVYKGLGESLCRALSMFASDEDISPTDSDSHLESSSSGYPPDLLFPSLLSLKLYKVEFDRETDGLPLYQVFAYALTLRTARSCSPQLLYLEDCYLRQQWVELWLYCVPKGARDWEVGLWMTVRET